MPKAVKGKWVKYRNQIDALLGIFPSDVPKFDTKKHSHTRPESKRLKRKHAKLARRRNRGR